jgi:hypothetical protein
MSKKPNLKNQEKLKLYLQKNDLQQYSKPDKATSNESQTGKKCVQRTSNGLSNR